MTLFPAEEDATTLSDFAQHGTHEVLAAQVDDYLQLSRSYAEQGDARRAALAVWAADVRAVQSLLFEGGLDDPANPDEQLLAVGDAVVAALAQQPAHEGHTVRTLMESARECLLAVFEDDAREVIRDRLVALDHLDLAPSPEPGSANEAVMDRLDGRGGEQLVGDLLTAAADCRAVARMLSMVGDDDEAARQGTSADLAAFEAYLILASAASGDATLAVTGLRWDLALAKADASAADGPPGSLAVREAILAGAVPAERPALTALLETGQPHRSEE
jgi:hypothetical protein